MYKKRLEYKFSQIDLLHEMLQSQEYSLISQFINKSKKINAVRWLAIYYYNAVNRPIWEIMIDLLYDESEEIMRYRKTNDLDLNGTNIDWQIVFDFVNDREILHHFFQKKQS